MRRMLYTILLVAPGAALGSVAACGSDDDVVAASPDANLDASAEDHASEGNRGDATVGMGNTDGGSADGSGGPTACTRPDASLIAANTPGKVQCISPTSTTPCNAPSEACCSHIVPGFGYAGTCVPATQACDGGVRNECEELADCPTGSVCCVTFDPMNGFSTTCATTCASTSESCRCVEDCGGKGCTMTGTCGGRGVFLSCGGLCPP